MNINKKIVLFHYSQSGQALEIAQSICNPLAGEGYELVYKAIEPKEPFPFPWNRKTFFETFPETRLGIPPFGIKAIDLSDVADAGLVVIAGQSWYLSPSLPIQAFFMDETIKNYLKGKNIVHISGCRNMWVIAQLKIRRSISEAGGNYVGHIVLQDNRPNLISVLTIIRWLFYNKKEASYGLPAAGVDDEEIKAASRFAPVLNEALKFNDWNSLQEKLMQAQAVEYKPSLAFVEKAGHRIFEIWAKFIRQKGEYQDKRRAFRLQLFFYYLLFVLYVISPFGLLFFYLTYPFRARSIKKERREMCFELGEI